jgi:methylenetetrahydrofolate dehydrogenase (NADP+) / methenyltetrahydrofolate cyclohydrolase
MSAALIDGVAVSKILRSRLQDRVAALQANGITPGLAVVLVGENPASQVYVRNKIKACAALGIHSELHQYPAQTGERTLLGKIAELNRAVEVHAILVQLPLPAQIDPVSVQDAIAPDKDADGLHPCNMGALMSGTSVLPPCTPAGVIALLDHYGIAIEGRNAVVVGRSNIVGKPVALMLLARNATVSICTSRTRDLAAHTRNADILVVATGKPGMLRAEMIKPGACVIDVGVNRLPDGRLTGDVDFERAKEVAGFLTPVPGGVGPMTITMLLANTIAAAERFAQSRKPAGHVLAQK